MRFKFLFLLCLVLFPFGVKAECDYQRKADLQKIASNVQINSSYRLNENRVPIFTIELSNITPDIYVVDNYGKTITTDSNKVFEVYDGASVKYDIYSADINCHGYKITTKYVKLQPYNRFFTFDECKEYPEFKYCSLWYKTDMNNSDFYRLLEDYKKDNSTVDENDVTEVNYTNLVIFVFIGILLIIVIAFVVRRRFYEK